MTNGVTYEIIVFDNASNDGSVAMLRQAFPQVTILSSTENVGFGIANNIALHSASGRYIVLLNPDTLIVNDVFSSLIQLLKDEPSVGLAGPKIISPDGSIQKSCARRMISLRSEFVAWLGLHKTVDWESATAVGLSPEEYKSSHPVDCISGACMVIRREVLENNQIFDPQFFMYGEDVELCRQVAKRGWLVYYQQGSTVIHYGGQSSDQNPLAVFHSFRSRYLFIAKSTGPFKALIYRTVLAIVATLKLIAATVIRLTPFYRNQTRWKQRCHLYQDLIKWSLDGFNTFPPDE